MILCGKSNLMNFRSRPRYNDYLIYEQESSGQTGSAVGTVTAIEIYFYSTIMKRQQFECLKKSKL